MENNCQFAVNGGFYDKQNRPIGLVVANKMTLNPGQKNYLFNGYLSDLGISYESPMMANWAIQTGPMLWDNNRPIKVSTTNDKSARRGVAIWSTDNKLHFVIFYNSQAETLGPYLNDMPEILESLSIPIKSAINLDGGQASAFYDGKIFLDEIDPVGTVLCAK